MKIKIRYQISDTYEEIYGFDIEEKRIRYNSIDFSRRNSINDVWGYDWYEHYAKQRESEIKILKDKEYLDTTDCDYELLDTLSAKEFSDICDKYNPVMNRTNDGKSFLSGISYDYLMIDNPPKIELSQLKELIKKEVLYMIEKSEIR